MQIWIDNSIQLWENWEDIKSLKILHHIIFLIDFKLLTKESSKATFLKNLVNRKVMLESMEYLIIPGTKEAVEVFNWIVQHIFTSGENHQKDNII